MASNVRTVTFWHRNRGWCYRVLGWLDEMIREGTGYKSKSVAKQAGIEAAKAYVASEDYRKVIWSEPASAVSGRLQRHKRSWRKIK